MNHEIRNQGTENQTYLEIDPQEEFSLLMSLALDGLLDEEEEARFDAALTRDPTLAEEWADWQEVHQLFMDTPAALPPFSSSVNSLSESGSAPSSFVQEFEQRLEQQTRQESRRRRFMQVAFISTLLFVLWGTLLVGIISIGTYLFNNQGVWVNEVMQTLTYWSAVAGQWVDAFIMAFNTTMNGPQMIGIGFAYIALSAAMLWVWVRMLRNTEMGDAVPSGA
ncbi:MAG: hypothetical protein AAF639_06550 [Chloroflexota bacterium]